MRVRSLLSLLLLATVLEVATIWTATAEMRVIDSNAPDYPVGTVLPDNAAISPGPGHHVRVLLPNNETKMFQGPVRSGDPGVGGTYGGVRGPRKPD
jgi:hypothetical protein